MTNTSTIIADLLANILELERRIEQLEAELVSLALEKQMRQMAEQSNVKLLAELAECKRDAERWREYQAIRIRLTEAGFGKSPLRDAAIPAMREKK